MSFTEFFTGTRWTPLFADPSYGVLPLVSATIVDHADRDGCGDPARPRVRRSTSASTQPDRPAQVVKPVLEVLAGVPTVVYGFFALKGITPLLQDIWPVGQGPRVFNALVAGFVMGIMIIPTVASLSEDAMSAVPRSLRDGAYALGSSRMLVATRVVVPAAVSGIVAAVRAGHLPGDRRDDDRHDRRRRPSRPSSWNPLEGMLTMTAFIAQAGSGDVPVGLARLQDHLRRRHRCCSS